jgi:hypothetical protein
MRKPSCAFIGCIGCLGFILLSYVVSNVIIYPLQNWTSEKLEALKDKRMNTPNPSAQHNIEVNIISYLEHTSFIQPETADKEVCPTFNKIQVKDDKGQIIADVPPVYGSKQAVRVKPIVLNCFYSFNIKNVPEVRSYNITSVGSFSLRKMKKNNWKIKIGEVDKSVIKK